MAQGTPCINRGKHTNMSRSRVGTILGRQLTSVLVKSARAYSKDGPAKPLLFSGGHNRQQFYSFIDSMRFGRLRRPRKFNPSGRVVPRLVLAIATLRLSHFVDLIFFGPSSFRAPSQPMSPPVGKATLDQSFLSLLQMLRVAVKSTDVVAGRFCIPKDRFVLIMVSLMFASHKTPYARTAYTIML